MAQLRYRCSIYEPISLINIVFMLEANDIKKALEKAKNDASAVFGASVTVSITVVEMEESI